MKGRTLSFSLCILLLLAAGCVPHLIQIKIQDLEDEDWSVREKAAGWLDIQGWKPTNRIEETKYYLAKQEWDKLVAIGAPAVEPLIKVLGDEDSYVRRYAAQALGETGDPRAVEALIKALGDEDRDVRKTAADALGKIGDSRAVEPLIKVLGDEVRYVRAHAAEALGEIGSASAVPALTKALKDRFTRQAAEEAIAKIKAKN